MILVLVAVVRSTKTATARENLSNFDKSPKNWHNIIGYRRGGDGCLHLVLMNEIKGAIVMELAEIRNTLEEMQTKINSFRGSL